MSPANSGWILVAIVCLTVLTAIVWITTKRSQKPLPLPAFKALRQVWFVAFVSAVLTLAAIVVSIAKSWPDVTLVDMVVLVFTGSLTVFLLYRTIWPTSPNQ